MEHAFTARILTILDQKFGKLSKDIFNASPLLQYLNIKSRSAGKGSKARGAFANHYALYVLVEDYINQGYHKTGDYSKYEGARFTELLKRQRELPFGAKLQNHALNSRLNDEFRKLFSSCPFIPIMRNIDTNRYWINENLLKVELAGKFYNIAEVIIAIIDAYVVVKKEAFEGFIETCEKLQHLEASRNDKVQTFVKELLQPNVDARVFEIVSFGILKQYYAEQNIYWGWTADVINEDSLKLYKTGRTNANDGGIDFVMRPLGRFFQVAETTNVRKYFLDIDKVQRFPITFVVKSTESIEHLFTKMQIQAKELYGVDSIVDKYMSCIEEIINIPILLQRFEEIAQAGKLSEVLDEIVTQSKVEFNYPRIEPEESEGDSNPEDSA